MKAIKILFTVIIAAFLLLYALPVLLLRTPAVEGYVTQKVCEVATKQLGVELSLGRVEFELFNRIALYDLYLEDQRGGALLTAGRLEVGVDLLDLLQHELTITSAQLSDFSVAMNQATPHSPLNIQFIIDTFSPKVPHQAPSPLTFHLNTLLMQKGAFSYDLLSAPETPGRFNPHHLSVTQIASQITLQTLSKDSINLNIRRLSAQEQSGIALHHLGAKAIGNRGMIAIKDLSLRMLHSEVNIPHITAHLPLTDSLPTIGDRLSQAQLAMRIDPSTVRLSDLHPFVPQLSGFDHEAQLSLAGKGNLSQVTLDHLTVDIPRSLHLSAHGEGTELRDTLRGHIGLSVKRLMIHQPFYTQIVETFAPQLMKTLDLEALGDLSLTADLNGTLPALRAKTQLSSGLGKVALSATLHDLLDRSRSPRILDASVETNELALGRLLRSDVLGEVTLALKGDVARLAPLKVAAQGTIKSLCYNQYCYQNSVLQAKIDSTRYEATLRMDDPNAQLAIDGSFEATSGHTSMKLDLDVDRLRPDLLNFASTYPNPVISGAVNAHFEGASLAEMDGDILGSSLTFESDEGKVNIPKLHFSARTDEEGRRLTLRSPILNGSATGDLTIDQLVPSVQQLLSAYLPSIVPTNNQRKKRIENDFIFRLDIADTKELSRILHLPFTTQSASFIEGSYNSHTNDLTLNVLIPYMQISNASYDTVRIAAQGTPERLDAQLSFYAINEKHHVLNHVEFNTTLGGDSVLFDLGWQVENESTLADTSLRKIGGRLNGLAKAKRSAISNEQIMKVELLPHSTLHLRSEDWTIEPAMIILKPNKIEVRNFAIVNDKQHLKIDGIISPSRQDTIAVTLNRVNLEEVFQSINITALSFGGEATGHVTASKLSPEIELNGALEIDSFSYNETPVGRGVVRASYDHDREGIHLDAIIHKNDSVHSTADGYIYIKDQKIDLTIQPNELDVRIIHPYIKTVINTLEGEGSGRIRIHESLDAPLITGSVMLRKGVVGLDVIGTRFMLDEDSISLSANEILLHDIGVSDPMGNRGMLNGTAQHEHFENFTFSGQMTCSDMLLYDLNRIESPMIYGKVFASGEVTLKGDLKRVNIDINMASSHGTDVGLNFMSASEAMQYNFISFTSDKEPKLYTREKPLRIKSRTQDRVALNDGVELLMNFDLDVGNNANITLVVDPRAGDDIRATGNGDIKILWGNRRDVAMYGTYVVDRGTYNFSLQQLVRKEFRVREGSKIYFNGDPMKTTLDIDALYLVSANIGDIDPGLVQETGRSMVPVNAVLNISDQMTAPVIGFDVELPTSNAELERQVKAIIASTGMMQRQIIYLLVLNKFYTQNSMVTGNNQMNDLSAFASATISGQLSHLLGSISENVQIGTNFRTNEGSEVGSEFDVMLSSQLLNNRLLINGNLGYRENTTMPSTFVGEFDLEYKLTPRGHIRLKAYNHYNDRHYYMQTGLTIQGVGFAFKRDFNKYSELLPNPSRLLRWEAITPEKLLVVPPPTTPTSTPVPTQ